MGLPLADWFWGRCGLHKRFREKHFVPFSEEAQAVQNELKLGLSGFIFCSPYCLVVSPSKHWADRCVPHSITQTDTIIITADQMLCKNGVKMVIDFYQKCLYQQIRCQLQATTNYNG